MGTEMIKDPVMREKGSGKGSAVTWLGGLGGAGPTIHALPQDARLPSPSAPPGSLLGWRRGAGAASQPGAPEPASPSLPRSNR